MWLLCHDESGGAAIDVATVHTSKETKLRSLIIELLPVAADLSGADIGTVEDVMQYLERYSMSMPHAIPNLDLAIEEISSRNGIFLCYSEKELMEHQALLMRVVGFDSVDLLHQKLNCAVPRKYTT